MTGDVELLDAFEAARPRLVSLAHRLLGSVHDAEDAVQAAWLRTQAAGPREVDNPDGWFTTVTARLCLDQLRSRQRRGEGPLLGPDVPDDRLAIDEAFLRREGVERALLVVLAQLSPRQRVAFVLHDLFGLPFEQVAQVLDTSTASAKKLASRARLRLRDADPDADAAPEHRQHAQVVRAFLDAAAGEDLARLVSLLAPDVVRTAHPALRPAGTPAVVRGARAVAEETSHFLDRIRTAAVLVVDGAPVAVIAPGGHPRAVVRFQLDHGLVTAIDLSPYR